MKSDAPHCIIIANVNIRHVSFMLLQHILHRTEATAGIGQRERARTVG
jgi:hypothetical protein